MLPKQENNEPSRRVAILFTDMKGSSAFYKTHGNLAGRIMIQRLNDMLSPIVKAHRGVVVKTIGDSIMAYFLAPKDALWTAIAMQQSLVIYNKEHGSDDQFLIRIAMDYGHGIVEERDVFGDVVNTAAKLVPCCEAQQILVTEAFYQDTKDASEIIFSPFQPPEKKERTAHQKIYQVHWEEIQAAATDNVCLLSLQVERTAASGKSGEDFAKILADVKRSALQVSVSDDETACAFFADARACLQTAIKALEQYLKAAAEREGLPRLVRIGLHAMPKAEQERRSSRESFRESIEAGNSAEPYEIILTASFFNELPHEIKQGCIPVQAGPGRQITHYRYRSGNLKEQAPVFISIVPDIGTPPAATLCFYCTSLQHPAARCPSKLIRHKTGHLERLGYLPLEDMRRLFHENLADILRPLGDGTQEERFDLLLNETRQDPYALAFFSFYEITAPFQLRTLSQLFTEHRDLNMQLLNKNGALAMGLDCLRVSRLEEAAEWFKKAAQEQANDYRVHLALGLVSIERSRLENALAHFHDALSFATHDTQRRHTYLLIARLYEVAGGLPNALQNAERCLSITPDWNAARYYLAVLLLKSGKTGAALETFRRLIQHSPHYYLIISLNPALNSAKKEISALLNRELVSIRNKAEKSFKNLKKVVDEYTPLLKRDDEDYLAGHDLYQKASGILQRESILGLTDLPGFELNVKASFERALTHRQRTARKKIEGLSVILQVYTNYLNKFPYRNLISNRHAELCRTFEQQLQTALRAIEGIPPPGLQETQTMLGRLAHESRNLVARQQRLEIVKQILFTLECSLKMSGTCVGTTILTTAIFTGVLILYQVYDDSVASLTSSRFIEFLRFGLFAGLFAGLCGMVAWFRRSFNKLHKKLET
jgi:class 3 adenylate cyclase/tetratricopeptide (TPR) repeat protein